MPEDLPTPEKSLKQLEKENKKVINKKQQIPCKITQLGVKYE